MAKALSIYAKPRGRLASVKFWVNLGLWSGQLTNAVILAAMLPRDSANSARVADLLFWVALGLGLLQFVITCLIYYDELSKETDDAKDKATRPEPLEASLTILYHCLLAAKFKHYDAKNEADAGLRMALMIPAPDNDKEIIQLTNYVGVAHGGIGRRFDRSKGVIGRAMRAKTSYSIRKPPDADRVKFLVESFGYTEEEAKQCREANVWSAMYIADRDTRKVICVLFCDCLMGEFFGKSDSSVRRLLESSVLGFAQAVARIYN